jgi:type VI secretion system VgrG family protein
MLPGFSSQFECKVNGIDETLTVLDFSYDVKLSELYVCKIEFISLNPDLDYWSFIDKKATLIINVKGATALQYVNGIVTEFLQKGQIGDGYSYEMILEPHFAQLKHQEQTEVFLNQSIPDVVESQLKHSHIKFRSELSQDYSQRPFMCQFQETDFNFISRWLEHEGIYYYFEQGVDFETLVLTDRYSTHKDHEHFSELSYNPNNLTSISESSFVVEQFTSRISKVARTLELKGYNYDDDTNTIVARQDVSSHGMGDIEIYDENVMDEQDAKRIAEIRAQEINCKEQVYLGTTLASNVVPGYRFKLTNHFRGANNQEYLVFDVHQNGSQRQIALSHLGLQSQDNNKEGDIIFVTEFKAIPGKVQFRAPSNTPVKKIDGIIPAVLDAETSGEYAQLDDQGRYKIRLLHSEKADGQSSDWVRKMESYIGNEYGHHFPMHKNTEICLAFQFGNPDRPVIMGGVHNSSNKNIVTSKNQKTSVTKSAGGNMIVMGDQKGQEYMHMHCPDNNSHFILGNVAAATANATMLGAEPPANDNSDWWEDAPAWPSNFKKPTTAECGAYSNSHKGSANLVYGNFYKYMHADSYTSTTGNSWSQSVGNSYSMTMGSSESFKLSNDFSATLGGSESISLGALNMSFTGTAAKLGVTYTAFEAAFSAAKAKFEITKAPKVYGVHEGKVIETAALGLSYTAATGGIKFNAGEGDITNTAVTGNIVNGAAKNIENHAAEGDIINKTVLGNILTESSAGNITITALKGITLKCGTNSITISETGIKIKSETNVVRIKGGNGAVKVSNTESYIRNGQDGIKVSMGQLLSSASMQTFGS